MRPDTITAHQAMHAAAARDRAAAAACIARLERDVVAARDAHRRALAELIRYRAQLAHIERTAKRAAGATREPFAKWVLGSLAIQAAAPPVSVAGVAGPV